MTGRPRRADVDAIGSPFAATMIDELPTPKQRPLEHIFPQASPAATDLLRKLLVFNPDKRITADEALRHPFVSQFHDPSSEPACDHVITVPISDNTKFTIQEYRDRLYQEIVRRKKELKRRLKEREASRGGRGGKGPDLGVVPREPSKSQGTPETQGGGQDAGEEGAGIAVAEESWEATQSLRI